MNPIFGLRPWIYFSLGPFIGHICMILYSIIHSRLIDSSNPSTLSELLAGFLIFIFVAYAIGAIPAFLTGLIINVMSKALHQTFRNSIFRLVVAASAGFLVTISLLILFCFYTNELDNLYKTDPSSVLATSIYGAIAAVICESLYFKMGSPSELP